MCVALPLCAQEPEIVHGDFVLRGTAVVWYRGRAKDVVIPPNLGITEIGNSAFSDNRHLASVIIPEGVATIGTRAFYGCNNLETVTLSRKTAIGEDVFPKGIRIVYN